MFRIRAAIAVLAITHLLLQSPESHGQNWPALRGANGYGYISTDGILAETSAVELKIRWKRKLGSGYSSVVVQGDRVVTMYTDGTNDLIVCLNAATGETIWETKTNPMFVGENGSFDGPLSTPVIHNEKVFAFSAVGELFCLSLEDGKKNWSKDLVEITKVKKPLYGFVTSPIVVADTLILQVGAPGKSVYGFDMVTGETKWTAGDDVINSQSPSVMEVNGKTILLAAGGKKLTGVDPVDGSVLFEYAHEGGNGQSVMPVPIGDGQVLLTHDDRFSQAVSIRTKTDQPGNVEGLDVEQAWQETSIKNTYNMPVLVDGETPGVFAYSTRILTCVDPKTGRPFWKTRKPGDGFLISVDGHLVVITKKGSLHLAKASNKGYEEISRISDLFKELVWSVPAYSDNSVFVRSFGEIARVDIVGTDQTEKVAASEQSELGAGFQKLINGINTAGSAEAKTKIVDRWMQAQAEFPVIEDGIVHFIYRGEEADVALAGDFFGARQEKQMVQVDSTDLFYYAMKLPADQRANYCFLVDFQPQTDSLNKRVVTSSMYAGEMEFAMRLSDKEPLKMSWFGMSKWKCPEYLKKAGKEKLAGELQSRKIDFEEDEGKGIELDVYLPPGYDSTGERRYPVAYVFDGANAQKLGEIITAADRLFQAAPEQSAIIVLLGGGGPGLTEQLEKRIVPFVDEEFKTVADRDSRVLFGCGFVATGALVTGAVKNDLFANVAVQSPLAFAAQEKMILDSMGKVEQETHVLLQWGRFDMFNPHENWDIREGSQRIFDGLTSSENVKVKGGMVNDSTDWSSWKNRYHEVFQMLRK
ncbi:MAG: PQQ-binding-like beta-propeller repeat protein [Mariniblastus sp.]